MGIDYYNKSNIWRIKLNIKESYNIKYYMILYFFI